MWHAFCIEGGWDECATALFLGFGRLAMGQNCSEGKLFLVPARYFIQYGAGRWAEI